MYNNQRHYLTMNKRVYNQEFFCGGGAWVFLMTVHRWLCPWRRGQQMLLRHHFVPFLKSFDLTCVDLRELLINQ